MGKRDFNVEIGRVCLVNYGANAGKICVIVDVIDQNRAWVDGPTSGLNRQQVPFRHLSLTPIVVKTARGARTGTLLKQMKAQDIDAKWEATSWAKQLKKQNLRKNLNDFDRFKVMVLRKKRSTALGLAVSKLKKAN